VRSTLNRCPDAYPRHDRGAARGRPVLRPRVRARRALPALIDASALDHETIFVSAGRRGLEIELRPLDLVVLTGAEVRSSRR
jgi:hypothetical protein